VNACGKMIAPAPSTVELPLPLAGRAIAYGSSFAVIVSGLMVRDARLRRALTMRVYDFAAKKVLILRSPPQAGVSKDGPHRSCPTKLSSICDSPARKRERGQEKSAEKKRP
jgi:hypothetical protein